MKNQLLFLLLLVATAGTAQKPYWQQKVDMTLNVTLHDSDNTLEGFEKIIYTNNAPDSLHYIWFHLWPNAYKNDRTAFSNQLLQQGRTDFYFSSKEEKGYINRLDFKINGVTAKWEDHPEHIDIIKLLLPAPLPPGQQITITTPFHVKLPYAFSRTGYSNGAFQVTQWYPKPAVYDAQGWHPMPYLEQGEYYNDFGDYDVTITLPQDYVVAGTGALQNEAERKWLQSGDTRTPDMQEKKPTLPYGHLKKSPASNKKPARANFFKTSYPAKTLQFRQTNVTDFAWMAAKNFHMDFDTCQLLSGKIIEVYTYYLDKPNTPWKKSVAFTKAALRFYSTSEGDYPYTSMHVAESSTTPGGMEYPAFTIIGPVFSEKELDIVIAHEVGHNWFQGALATNERAAPWLDEGVNSFYEKKYSAPKYGETVAWERLFFQSLVKEKRDQPIIKPAASFTQMNYELVAYNKTAQWLALVEKQAGPELFQKAMQGYYNQWKFKHPQEADFKKALADVMPDTTAFALLHQKGALPNQQLSGFKMVSPLWPRSIKSYLQNPPQHMLFLSPAIGYNNYDKLMLGGVITNYGLPLTNLRFVAVPLYATGSKSWNGIGNIVYRFYSAKQFRKIEVGVTGMGFSKRYMLDSNGQAQYEQFYKVAPHVRFTWNEPLQSTRERALEWKTFFIKEKNFSSFVTKAEDGRIYVDSLKPQSYYVNQLSWNVSDYRTLYPYNYQVQLQQGRAFYRINLTGNYFFNYAKGGGASVRLFAAKFGYLTNNTSKRLGTARFQPKLLGVTGEEDYTYSSYFLGRTASYANDASVVKNSGLAAQQIMLRDGAFKLRLDPFEFLQGRSENWVAALNLATTLPHQVVPKFLPLKLFLDVGMYAEAGKQDAETNRILYVGGLQLPLLQGLINIYAPLVYSSDFRENLKNLPEQNTFFKRLTFSVDLSQLSMQRLTRNKLSL